MSITAVPHRTGPWLLRLQCFLLFLTVVTQVFKLGPVPFWVFVASLLAGLAALLAGVLGAIVGRKLHWLSLSLTAVVIALVSIFVAVFLSGGFGV